MSGVPWSAVDEPLMLKSIRQLQAHLCFQSRSKSSPRGRLRCTVNVGKVQTGSTVYCTVTLVGCVSFGRSREGDHSPL